jgi:LysR family hydrogen peroxide-inducible transcriptional activator
MEITIRQLEYFLALSETENFGRAADACYITQPALSAQIAQLEKTLGVQLVERGRKATLTPAGQEVADRARQILAEVRALHDGAAGFKSPLVGRIRLGVDATISPYLIPRILPWLRDHYPRLDLALREGGGRELGAAVAAGDLDLAFVALGGDGGGFEEFTIAEDRFVLLVPEGHALAGRKHLAQADLVGHRVLLLEDGQGLDASIVEAIAQETDGYGDFRAASLTTLVAMVRNGVGVTLIPELAVASDLLPEAGVVLARLDPPEPARRIGLQWRRGATRAKDYRLLGQILKRYLERPQGE